MPTYPVVPGRRYEDRPVADPADAGLEQVAAIRADLDARLRKVLTEIAAQLTPPPVLDT